MTESEFIRELTTDAMDVRQRAYAPYSDFLVGACVHCKDGKRYLGANVENASFGLTCCAERTALFSAVADGQSRTTITAIVIASDGGVAPCGACRQVIAELAREAVLYLVDIHDPSKHTQVDIDTLLPAQFELPKNEDE